MVGLQTKTKEPNVHINKPKITILYLKKDGNHGYYNNESTMHPIFIAHGPAFKENFTVPTFNNVDIYPLMCQILKILPAVNNGSLDIVRLMLVETDFCESITSKVNSLKVNLNLL